MITSRKDIWLFRISEGKVFQLRKRSKNSHFANGKPVVRRRRKHASSVWEALAHLAYLTITYQLVKLFDAALKKAAKNRANAGI